MADKIYKWEFADYRGEVDSNLWILHQMQKLCHTVTNFSCFFFESADLKNLKVAVSHIISMHGGKHSANHVNYRKIVTSRVTQKCTPV